MWAEENLHFETVNVSNASSQLQTLTKFKVWICFPFHGNFCLFKVLQQELLLPWNFHKYLKQIKDTKLNFCEKVWRWHKILSESCWWDFTCCIPFLGYRVVLLVCGLLFICCEPEFRYVVCPLVPIWEGKYDTN